MSSFASVDTFTSTIFRLVLSAIEILSQIYSPFEHKRICKCICTHVCFSEEDQTTSVDIHQSRM